MKQIIKKLQELVLNFSEAQRRERVEEMANNVKTKEELEHIWYNEYNELVKKCQGGAQIGEVRRIRAIIETRLKYWK